MVRPVLHGLLLLLVTALLLAIYQAYSLLSAPSFAVYNGTHEVLAVTVSWEGGQRQIGPLAPGAARAIDIAGEGAATFVVQSPAGSRRSESLYYTNGSSVRLSFYAHAVHASYATDSQWLAPFTSDGCSAFPDGTLAQQTLWLDCCTAHDLAYWRGGSYDQRSTADLALRQCVAQVGEEEIGLLMLAGVRAGGSPLWPTAFRWGYGWPYPRWYRELSTAEQRQVAAASDRIASAPPVMIEQSSQAPGDRYE